MVFHSFPRISRGRNWVSMRLASFFFISVTVHALALAYPYPVSFLKPAQTELIRVAILLIEHEPSGSTSEVGSGGSPIPRAGAKWPERKARNIQHSIESKPINHPQPHTQLVTAPPNPIESDGAALTFIPSKSNENENTRVATNFSAHGGDGADGGGVGGGANGTGPSGIIAGRGNGNGASVNGTGATLTQARYRDTPKPIYPESARQQGREGRVLLRVLVDDQGRAKAVEINKSSGDDSLDRAAGEAIKRWRFIPAHYGDKAVESWIRIPVDFHLADANSW
jgi:TonB family protein